MNKLILLSTLILASGVTFAAENNDKLAQLDADQDGLISVKEASIDADLVAMFAQLDANKDGYLSTSELESSDK